MTPKERHDYYITNRARERSLSDRWYQRNKSKVARRLQERRKSNPEHFQKKAKAYYAKHRDRFRKWYKNYYQKHKQSINQKTKMRRARNPKLFDAKRSRQGRIRRLSKYNITQDQYDDLVKKQGGLCAICQKPPRHIARDGKVGPLNVDHCHKTERVRGLLCHNCNVSLGLFDHNVDILRAATNYLVHFLDGPG